MVFPDGTLAVDHIEDLIECQKTFMEVVAEIRREQSMFTYPVLTYSLLKRKNLTKNDIQRMIKTKDWDIFVDKDFARWWHKSRKPSTSKTLRIRSF